MPGFSQREQHPTPIREAPAVEALSQVDTVTGESLAASRRRDAQFRSARQPHLERRLRRHDRLWMPLAHVICTMVIGCLLGSKLAAFTTGPQNRFIPEDPSQRMAHPLLWIACILGGLIGILFVLAIANFLIEEWGRRYRQDLCDQIGTTENQGW